MQFNEAKCRYLLPRQRGGYCTPFSVLLLSVFSLRKHLHLVGWFDSVLVFVNLTGTGVTEEIPPLDSSVNKSVRDFLIVLIDEEGLCPLRAAPSLGSAQ